MSDRKAVIKNADMSEEMQQDAVDCATQALEKYNIEKDIAAYIKKEFDKKYNPTWHCIVGRNFGSYVTHETKHFIYFYLGQVAILLFKSGWETSNHLVIFKLEGQSIKPWGNFHGTVWTNHSKLKVHYLKSLFSAHQEWSQCYYLYHSKALRSVKMLLSRQFANQNKMFLDNLPQIKTTFILWGWRRQHCQA